MLFSQTREDITVNKIPMLLEKPKRLIYISLHLWNFINDLNNPMCLCSESWNSFNINLIIGIIIILMFSSSMKKMLLVKF